MLYLCTFRVSNTTTLIIMFSAAVLAFVSMVSTSKLRYLVLMALTLALLLELLIRREGSGLFVFSVLVRFVVTGLLITFFGTFLTQASQRLYLDMKKVAAEREAALAESRRWVARLNALVRVISVIGTKNHLREMLESTLVV
jgi:hypothetical protein